MRAFRDAGLQVGDRLSAEAAGPGRVVLTRLAEPDRSVAPAADEEEEEKDGDDD